MLLFYSLFSYFCTKILLKFQFSLKNFPKTLKKKKTPMRYCEAVDIRLET